MLGARVDRIQRTERMGGGRILSLDINKAAQKRWKRGEQETKKIEIKNCDAQPPTQDYGTRMSLHGGEFA